MSTDLYQVTMAYAYWKSGVLDREACFHASFRSHPFGGGFTIACGLEQAIEYVRDLRFTADDAETLSRLTGNDGAPLFSAEFLGWLQQMRFTGDIHAVPEGTVVFPNEPVMRVTGPIAECQLLETTLLNILNFQTLIATKAQRLCLSAGGSPVIEFGLRRAQGPDGGLSASRAAYVGGCAGTSNLLARQRFGIPVGGTHAHSLVMAFDSELEAFLRYSEAMPNNVVLLVDTYDTIEGIRNAIRAGHRLRELGSDLYGIRLDSGDLAYFAKKARRMLDEAGFSATKIYASNELDEYTVASLKEQGAPIDVWGVGTKLATAYDQPALGGVYKLSAIREPGGDWQPKIKISEQTSKITIPGLLQVRRFIGKEGRFTGDMIYDELRPPAADCRSIDLADDTHVPTACGSGASEELLVPIFTRGRLVYGIPPIAESRERTAEQVACLDPRHLRFLNPQTYRVGVEASLFAERTRLIVEAREHAGAGGED
ncbi:MAG: nicotinate phosphoribosyltransferase [Coriobacteriia bacterium]